MEKLSTLNDNQNILLKRDVLAKFNVDLDKVFALSKKILENLNHVFDKIDAKYLSVTELSIDHDLRRDLKKQLHGRSKFEEKNIPFHVDDRDWIISYVAELIQQANPHKKYTVDEVAEMKTYLETSPEFKQALVNYEQNIIKATIENTVISDLSAEQSKKHRQDRSMYKFEDVFRSKVLFNMDLLGIDRQKTDVTLEKNADVWRRQNMLRSFNEYYYHIDMQPTKLSDVEHWEHLHRVHADRWLKYREYIYYQEHKDVIDAAGTATDNMKMSGHRASEVSHGLCQCNDLLNEIISNDLDFSEIQNVEQTIRVIF